MSPRFTAAFLATGLCLAGAAQADSVTYTYDAFGRIKTVTYYDGTTTKVVTYTYDDAGNITAVALVVTP